VPRASKRFVFASTVYVYSESGSFYRASKQAAERFVEAYYERYGLPFSVLRYGSLYGRRADQRNGIYRLLKQALEQRTIAYEGSAEAMREYIHVSRRGAPERAASCGRVRQPPLGPHRPRAHAGARA
jgi:UDP-glucose 4-epimerase